MIKIMAKFCGLVFGDSEDRRNIGDMVPFYGRFGYRPQGWDSEATRMRKKKAESLGITEVGEGKGKGSQTSQRGKQLIE